jgi:hypothetical protein
MLCPLKFNNPNITPERIIDLCQCEQSQCVWWVDDFTPSGNNPRCVIISLKTCAVFLENIDDTLVKK